MRSRFAGFLGEAIAGGIVFGGIVAVAFALTGRWPPQAVTLGASIGGMLSPAFWRRVRNDRDGAAPPADERANPSLAGDEGPREPLHDWPRNDSS